MLQGTKMQARLGALTVASAALTVTSACGTSGTSAAPRSDTSPQPVVQATSSRSVVRSDSASPLPTYSPGEISTLPAEASGGSSIQLKTPCDSGTMALRAYPIAKGVAMTATLLHTMATTWRAQGVVSPEVNPVGDAALPEQTARNGLIVVKADNLKGSNAVGGVSHAWPQLAEADLYAQPSGLSCSSSVYLDAREAKAATPELTVDAQRSGSITVQHGGMRSPGVWQVKVTATSTVASWHRDKDAVGFHSEGDYHQLRSVLHRHQAHGVR
jgi:hypothetical protein